MRVSKRSAAYLLVVGVMGGGGAGLGAGPTARDDGFVGAPGASMVLDVLANDGHDQGAALRIDGTTQPAQGSVAGPNPDGTLTFHASPTQVGSVAFSYTIRDELGGSSTATVSVSDGTPYLVLREPTGLVANALSGSLIELSWWDQSAEETHFRVFRAVGLGGAFQEIAPAVPPAPGVNSLVRFIDQPQSPFNPQTTLRYRVDTCAGSTCLSSAEAKTDVPAGSGNQAPIIVRDAFTLLNGGQVAIPFSRLLLNDYDYNQEAVLRITKVQGIPVEDLPAVMSTNSGYARISPLAGGQGVVVVAQGPELVDSFGYTVVDGQGGETTDTEAVQLTIDPGVSLDAMDDHFSQIPKLRTAEGVPLFIDYDTLLDNDVVDSATTLFTPNFTKPEHGRLEFWSGYVGTNRANRPLGVWYVPDEGHVDKDTFTYTIYRGGIQQPGETLNSYDSATVTLDVFASGGFPDATVPLPDSLDHILMPDVPEPESIFVFSDLLLGYCQLPGQCGPNGGDPGDGTPDLGDHLRIKLAFLGWTDTESTILEWITPGFLPNQVPPSDYDGAFRLKGLDFANASLGFDYELRGDAPPSDGVYPRARVKITARDPASPTNPLALRAINDLLPEDPEAPEEPPTAVISGKRLQIGWTTLTENDWARDGAERSLAINYFSPPRRGTLGALNHGGGFSYWAPTNYEGIDYFTYGVESPGIPMEVSIGRVVVKVKNGAPKANPDSRLVLEGGSFKKDVVSNDEELVDGDPLRLTLVGVSQTPNAETSVAGDGKSVIYSAKPGFVGIEYLTYTVRDPDGNTAVGELKVRVHAAPIALDDEAFLTRSPKDGELEKVSIPVLANDSDPAPDGGAVQLVSVSPAAPLGGQVIEMTDGHVAYVPPNEFPVGAVDRFTYTIKDDEGEPATATVTVRLDPSALQATGGEEE